MMTIVFSKPSAARQRQTKRVSAATNTKATEELFETVFSTGPILWLHKKIQRKMGIIRSVKPVLTEDLCVKYDRESPETRTRK
jgi:hypothetical protein